MKILITGASGFIGRQFAEAALAQGFDVRINARRQSAVAALEQAGAECMPGDLADAEFVKDLCLGVDGVVNCAGLGGTWGRAEDFHRANVLVTENLVEACLKRNVQRLVQLSSASVYCNGQAQSAITERPLAPRVVGADGATHRLAEQKVFGAIEFGLQVVVLRPYWVVGAGDPHRLARLLAQYAKGRLAIIGNGLNKVDFTSVSNLNVALFSALYAAEAALGRAYNISNGALVPVWDAFNYVLRQLSWPRLERYRSVAQAQLLAGINDTARQLWPGRPQPLLTRRDTCALAQTCVLDIGSAQEHLDYRPLADVWSSLDAFCAGVRLDKAGG